jgi:hypothetical protein
LFCFHAGYSIPLMLLFEKKNSPVTRESSILF